MLRLALSILTVISTSGLAQELVSFENGQVAEAADVNANFSLLLEKIESLQQRVQSLESSSQASFGCTGKVAAFSPSTERNSILIERISMSLAARHCTYQTRLPSKLEEIDSISRCCFNRTGTTWLSINEALRETIESMGSG